jgi:hypothetical protein
MKKVLTLLSFLVFATSGYSQYIEIENPFLRDKLKALAPECFDGERMDTTCSKLLEIKSISFSDQQLGEPQFEEYYKSTGLKYLKNLQGIGVTIGYCDFGMSKEDLPASLKSISATIDFYQQTEIEAYIGIDAPDSVTNIYLNGGDRMGGGSIGCTLSKYLEKLVLNGSYVSISEIPNTVKTIYDGAVTLDAKTILPNSLIELTIESTRGDEETNLPKFPTSLRKLFISGLYPGEKLNLTLNNGLEYFKLTNSQFIEPINYPTSLKSLYYWDNQYSELGKIPTNIDTLEISRSIIADTISYLPTNLKSLTLNYNTTILPTLPNQLSILNVSNNSISSITNLPNTLKNLNVSKNKLEILEKLPTQLENLNVSGNTNLKCLPTLPNSLKTINVSATKITCIPNETDKIKSTISLPLCPNPCGETPDLIAGMVFLDINKNGIFDNYTDERIQGAFIHVNDKIVTTNINGDYRFYADTDIENKISVTYNHPHLDKILPAQRTYTNSGNSERIDTMNFAVQLKDVKDIEVLIAPCRARNGSTSQVYITVTNRGTVFVNNFNLSLHSPLDWTIQNTSPTAQSVSDSILWNKLSLSVNQSKTYKANLTVPASAIINSPYSITAKLHQIADDVNLENNTNTYSSFITGSYDPNDKLVTPEILAPNYAEGTELIYTVRFQNTGNDTAFNVVVLDTILEHLDPLTFRVIEKSHPLEWYLNENREVTFNFNNINLPDSNVNEVASHGYVTFAIQPLPNLASGTIFENRAAIYFDFNAPIMTNYAISKVNIITVINEKNALQLNVYPNPTKDILNIRWNDSGKTKLSISDISGKAIFQSVEIGNYKQIPTQNLSKGMYFIQIQNEQGLGISKIIVQ